MFYQPSASRDRLAQWVRDSIDCMTFTSPDRSYLDHITTSEVLDLAYLEGAELSEAIGAHALFLPHIDRNAMQRGYGASSSIEVAFPITISEASWGYDLHVRGGRPSVLAIGQGGRFPRQNVDADLPQVMRAPQIDGTSFELHETAGRRLRAVAGPLELIERAFHHTIEEASGTHTERIVLSDARDAYAYVDEQGVLHAQLEADGLQPLANAPQTPHTTYLRAQRLAYTIQIDVAWERLQADRARMTVKLHLVPQHARALTSRDTALGTLVLPHLQIALRGAVADFPTQQYAETKQQFLTIDDDSRHDAARQRLYQVQQSGCIATRHPHDPQQVALTTFGVFDTPRETPLAGPRIAAIARSPSDLLHATPAHAPETARFVERYWDRIQAVLHAARAAFHIEHLHQFQWDAIAMGLELEATNRSRAVTIVRAPTGAGKTIVFMVNAAISALCGDQRSASVLLFPTRLLNEDMFRRLLAFVYHLRQHLPTAGVTGGIFMGTSDPLYKLLLQPELGEIMHQYGQCPACESGQFAARRAAIGPDIVPTCIECGHTVEYMFNPKEVAAYLPDIIIATPDKLFFDATVSSYDMRTAGLFGSPSRRCTTCNRAYPEAWFALKPQQNRCAQVFKKAACSGTFVGPAIAKPLRYMGFDEVHNLHGETVTYLSAFLATLEAMQRILAKQRDLCIRYETATATIANERELLEAITRRRLAQGEIIAIPSTDTMGAYFTVSPDRIRHRVLLTMPARISSRDAMIRLMLNAYRHLRGPDPDLKHHLRATSSRPDAWDFLLGYVFKRQDGLDLRRALGDFYQNKFDQTLNIGFLSGMAPKNQISQLIEQARQGDLDVLLANLVVSLGVDIHDLNHMIMFGVPGSFTEYVQTAGRTGRGMVSGHVNIVLFPNYPRDTYLYRHFHAVFSDVSGYYDALPVRSTNLHCSEEMFGNVAKGLLSTLCLDEPTWSNRAGILKVTEQKGREGALRGGIARILCDDARLQRDTEQLVLRKYRMLKDVISTEGSFLGDIMEKQGWLLRGLRGRSASNVKVMCADQALLDILGGAPTPTDDADEGEQE